METVMHRPHSAALRSYTRPGRMNGETYYALNIKDGRGGEVTLFGAWEQIHGMCEALAQAHEGSTATHWCADE